MASATKAQNGVVPAMSNSPTSEIVTPPRSCSALILYRRSGCRVFPGEPGSVPYAVWCSGYRVCATEGGAMTETGQITGTKDKDYNIIWFTEACLSNALRLENYIQDADREGDQELAEFFRRAQNESRKGAEQGKQLLASRIAASS
jgi:hypothetical protein